MTHRTLGVFLLALALAGCSSTDPDDEGFDWSGNYTLTVQASPSCASLPSSTYVWNVTVTTSAGGEAVAALPGVSSADFDFSFQAVEGVYIGSLSTSRAPAGAYFVDTYSDVTRLRPSSGPGGRPQIVDGGLNGGIDLDDGDRGSWSCNAGNHTFSFVPR